MEEKLCRRCKVIYRDSSNNASSCRFHPSFFVCRRHDDQKRFCPPETLNPLCLMEILTA
ncbi:hypothetical protein F2Q68_00045888 [Brassica cretica]|uniref:Uncharacterized protein n=1 Tax=Brassica cretica TaxID=69181 RepID=A0A8S9LKH0_BRACR|nr:hypothetical protein F2Q68_00045888 [Brassica cretica]